MRIKNTQSLEKIKAVDRFLKEIYAYEKCDRQKGDNCPKAHCTKSILILKSGECGKFICGRSNNYMKGNRE